MWPSQFYCPRVSFVYIYPQHCRQRDLDRIVYYFALFARVFIAIMATDNITGSRSDFWMQPFWQDSAVVLRPSPRLYNKQMRSSFRELGNTSSLPSLSLNPSFISVTACISSVSAVNTYGAKLRDFAFRTSRTPTEYLNVNSWVESLSVNQDDYAKNSTWQRLFRKSRGFRPTQQMDSTSHLDAVSIKMDESTDSLSSSVEEHPDSEPAQRSPVECVKVYILTLFDNFSVGPFCATATFFIFCLYVNSVAQVFTEKRATTGPKQPILDLGFDWFISLQGQREYADLFVVGACVASFARFMPTYIRWAFLRRFLFFYGVWVLKWVSDSVRIFALLESRDDYFDNFTEPLRGLWYRRAWLSVLRSVAYNGRQTSHLLWYAVFWTHSESYGLCPLLALLFEEGAAFLFLKTQSDFESSRLVY